MDKLNKLFFVLILLAIASWIGWGLSIAIDIVIPHLDYKKVSEIATVRFYLKTIPPIVTNLAVGIWLFIAARGEKESNWIWCIIGLAIGPVGLVLLYCVRIYRRTVPRQPL